MRIASSGLLLALLLASAAILFSSRYSVAGQDRAHPGDGPSALHSMGTDDLGRDRLVRTAAAALIGIAGSAAAAAVAGCLAVGAALLADMGPGWCKSAVLFFSDAALTLPWLFLLMIVRSALPLNVPAAQSAVLTFAVLALTAWPAYVRPNYARIASVRKSEWKLYLHACGLPPRALVRHLLPHLYPIVLIQFIVALPLALIAEANLGTLGLGIAQPLPSWGGMLNEMQSISVLSSSRAIYLPIALLVATILLIESIAFEAKP